MLKIFGVKQRPSNVALGQSTNIRMKGLHVGTLA